LSQDILGSHDDTTARRYGNNHLNPIRCVVVSSCETNFQTSWFHTTARRYGNNHLNPIRRVVMSSCETNFQTSWFHTTARRYGNNHLNPIRCVVVSSCETNFQTSPHAFTRSFRPTIFFQPFLGFSLIFFNKSSWRCESDPSGDWL